jgi:hypothetical protein
MGFFDRKMGILIGKWGFLRVFDGKWMKRGGFK